MKAAAYLSKPNPNKEIKTPVKEPDAAIFEYQKTQEILSSLSKDETTSKYEEVHQPRHDESKPSSQTGM
jgi:hypothetical protein